MKHSVIAAALAAAIVLTPAVPAGAQAVGVTIGGRSVALNPAPIEQNGRVFVPLRGVFEQLGATVVYSNGQINATRGATTVSLTIGSTQAVINGKQVYLDVAPFIVGNYTYVPLRFLAQSLGAAVNYVSSSNLVAISMPGRAPYPPPAPRPPYPPPPPRPAPPPVNLTAVRPQNNAAITNRFATISAGFTRPIVASSVRVVLDGNGITSQCSITRNGISYSPPAPLGYGWHTVRVAGVAGDGVSLDQNWKFYVAGATTSLNIVAPADGSTVAHTFDVRGNTVAGATVQVVAQAGNQRQFRGTTVANG
ncbi:MAG: copper amine oxidase N-terminal domain-containing protein, partial [Candidatus Eremiobacteraeota bacterium]|nr:copper amine oxidase N-terminal domain-containing protein [Candidatus Eremiobacteraeota bacterium]